MILTIQFITILKNLYNSPDNSVFIILQCVSYLDGSTVGAKSVDFKFIKDDTSVTKNAIKGLTTLEIVLICVSVILGIMLMLGLIILLYCCCCGGLYGKTIKKDFN